MAETDPPVVANVAAAPDPVNVGATVTVSADVTDDTGVASVEYQLDGAGPWIAMTAGASPAWAATFAAPSAGSHQACVRATDSDAIDGPNTSAGTDCDTFTVNEATPPSVTSVMATPDPQGYDGDVVVTADVTDATGIATVEYKLDAGSWTPMSLDSGSTFTATMVSPGIGSHTVCVRATDTATPVANTSAGTDCDTFTVNDVVDPVVSNVTADDVVYGSDVVVMADVTDDGTIDTVEYTIDGGTTWDPMAAGTAPAYSATITKPDVGTYTACVLATDGGDNTNDWTVACDDFEVTPAAAAIAFTGNSYNVDGSTVKLEATVQSICKAGASVTFDLDTDGDGYDDGTYSATANSAGVATYTTTLPTSTIADVRVSVAAGNCVYAEGYGVVIVAGTGDASNGGGAYNNTGRINFGYSLQSKFDKKLQLTTVTGRILWSAPGKVRAVGRVTGYTRTGFTCPNAVGGGSPPSGNCALVTGSLTIYTWDDVALEWDLAATNVAFRLYVVDGGTSTTCLKRSGSCTTNLKSDWIAMTISSGDYYGESTSLYPIKGGNIVVK